MRIIGGKYKGRHIPVPSSFKARPTTDFAREGLFNILANTWEFEDLVVLDLFAGTGSIGFEFASRGAAKVDMVEKESRSTGFLRNTASKLSTGEVKVIHSDALKFIQYCSRKYDIVFADPPYDLEIIPDIPDLLFKSDLIVPEGWFILEHGRKHSFNSHPYFHELRKYGNVHFSIFINLTPNQ